MPLFRVDNRLVHGQIIEAWLPFLQAKRLIVANDELAKDHLRQQIVSLAIPKQIIVSFITLGQLPSLLDNIHEKTLVVLENCADLKHILTFDLVIPRINIGNLHFGANKKQLLPHVAVTEDEYNFLEDINKKYLLDFRAIPTEKPRGLHEL